MERKHKDKESKAEKQQAASPNRSEPLQGQPEEKDAGEPKSDEGPVIQECCKDNTIQLLEENEGYRESIARVSEGSDIEVESKMPRCLMKAQEVSGLHKGQRGMLECGIRWAVEARRKGRGTEGSKPQKRSKAREGTSSRGRVASGTAGRGRAGPSGA